MMEIKSEEFIALKTAVFVALGAPLLESEFDTRIRRLMIRLEELGFKVVKINDRPK